MQRSELLQDKIFPLGLEHSSRSKAYSLVEFFSRTVLHPHLTHPRNPLFRNSGPGAGYSMNCEPQALNGFQVRFSCGSLVQPTQLGSHTAEGLRFQNFMISECSIALQFNGLGYVAMVWLFRPYVTTSFLQATAYRFSLHYLAIVLCPDSFRKVERHKTLNVT